MISPPADKYHRAFLRVWLVADNTIAKYFMRIWQLLNYKLTQFVEVTPSLFGNVCYVFIDVVDMDIIRLLCKAAVVACRWLARARSVPPERYF